MYNIDNKIYGDSNGVKNFTKMLRQIYGPDIRTACRFSKRFADYLDFLIQIIFFYNFKSNIPNE